LSARQLLDWLSNAESSLRYQTSALPDSEDQLESQLAQLEVDLVLNSYFYFDSLYVHYSTVAVLLAVSAVQLGLCTVKSS